MRRIVAKCVSSTPMLSDGAERLRLVSVKHLLLQNLMRIIADFAYDVEVCLESS